MQWKAQSLSFSAINCFSLVNEFMFAVLTFTDHLCLSKSVEFLNFNEIGLFQVKAHYL
jgi:hypothetical protein